MSFVLFNDNDISKLPPLLTIHHFILSLSLSLSLHIATFSFTQMQLLSLSL